MDFFRYTNPFEWGSIFQPSNWNISLTMEYSSSLSSSSSSPTFHPLSAADSQDVDSQDQEIDTDSPWPFDGVSKRLTVGWGRPEDVGWNRRRRPVNVKPLYPNSLLYLDTPNNNVVKCQNYNGNHVVKKCDQQSNVNGTEEVKRKKRFPASRKSRNRPRYGPDIAT